MNENLYILLRKNFPKSKESLFTTTPSGSQIAYSDVDNLTARLAGALRTLGLGHGDRLISSVEKSPEALLLYLAILRLGAILVPLNTAYTIREFRYFVDDIKPKVVVVRPDIDTEQESVANASGAKIATLGINNTGSLYHLMLNSDPIHAIEPVKTSDIASIIYTSGTTGTPKGAMLSHGNLISNAVSLNKIWGFRADDVLMHALPIFHVHGLFVAVHCAMLSGCEMIYLPKFEIDMVINLLPSATVLMGVPTFYTRLLEDHRLNEQICQNMRLFISGSAPLLPQTWESFLTRTGHKILERYGMTETGMIASNPLNGKRIPGTVGFALPDVTLRVCNDDGTVIPTNEEQPGILELRGPNVFEGYWRKANSTQSEFRKDGFFISGDVAQMASNGRITIVGRKKDVVISGGLNIYPREIENCLNQLSGITESAVIGIPHSDYGEILVAIVAGDSDLIPNEEDIISLLRFDLARFKIPRRVFCLDQLPKNTMGKIQKDILKNRYMQLVSNS
ncbi:MAG: malonyl-CoA synthase [Acidiferrobacteraceae bacterium]|nr:malonyl-CoA synthase [Acidiferrobacteraceae bacterium]|tara:strand:- start:2456 stop:3979 length:1524 start_codon:yes stop_codon:yes gene_type:complete